MPNFLFNLTGGCVDCYGSDGCSTGQILQEDL